MDFQRIYAHCTSYAVSVLLVAAFFCAVSPTVVADETTVVAPAKLTKHATPAPETRPFTGLQLQKLNQRWDTKEDFAVVPEYSRLLGLTRGDETARLKRIGGKDDKGVRHAFGRLANGSGYFLSREPNPKEMHAYWVGLDFKVIAAISLAEDQSLSILPASVAQKELESEYKDWAEYADKL